jgi:hypothetical protein
MNNPRPLAKEILIEETHEGRGRVIELDGFYYAEAKKGKAWQLILFSEFLQVARMALNNFLAEDD